jgi:hypothetical protein
MDLSLALVDGYAQSTTICLPPGTYAPFSCGGQWPGETSWRLPDYDFEGSADVACAAISGSFTVGAGGAPPLQRANRFFSVEKEAGVDVFLSISDVTLTRFGAADSLGGALYLTGLENATFQQVCAAAGTAGGGDTISGVWGVLVAIALLLVLVLLQLLLLVDDVGEHLVCADWLIRRCLCGE